MATVAAALDAYRSLPRMHLCTPDKFCKAVYLFFNVFRPIPPAIRISGTTSQLN
jgi:hypothetical protein